MSPKYHSIGLGLLLATAACKKEREADLHPLAANTFTCQIDGQSFTPKLPLTLASPPPKALTAGRSAGSGGFFLEARDSFNQVYINVAAAPGPGTYALGYAPLPPLGNPNLSSFATYTRIAAVPPGVDPYTYSPPPPTLFTTTALSTGSVTLTRCDTIAHVLSGQFTYSAQDKTGQVVHLTNGSFDVSY